MTDLPLIQKLTKRKKSPTKRIGRVYILHLNRPHHHAKHYVGFTMNTVEGRLNHHRRGIGSKFLKAVMGTGNNFELVRIFENADRHFERWVKDQKQTEGFCPVCAERRQVTLRTPRDVVKRKKPKRRKRVSWQ